MFVVGISGPDFAEHDRPGRGSVHAQIQPVASRGDPFRVILDYFDLVTFRAGGRKENWGDEIDFKTLSEEEKKRLYIRFIADNHHSLI